MNHTPSDRPGHGRYELRFVSLFDPGRACTFPCDAGGCVDLDALGPRVRLNYLYARTVIGREFATPVMCAVARCQVQTSGQTS